MTTRESYMDLKDLKGVTPEQVTLIEGFIKNSKNILITGEKSTGKTTLLNALLAEIPDKSSTTLLFSEEDFKTTNTSVVLQKLSTHSEGVSDLFEQLATDLTTDYLLIDDLLLKNFRSLLDTIPFSNDRAHIVTVDALSPFDACLAIVNELQESKNVKEMIKEVFQLLESFDSILHMELVRGVPRLAIYDLDDSSSLTKK